MSTKPLKWNRSDTGQYVTPDRSWMIKGQGVHWKLYHNGPVVFESSSKKECQEHAQKAAEDDPEPVRKGPPPKPKKDTPEEPPTPKKSLASSVKSLTTAVDTGRGSESLDGALRSLYLQLSQTSSMIGVLASHAIEIEKELKEITKFLRKYK